MIYRAFFNLLVLLTFALSGCTGNPPAQPKQPPADAAQQPADAKQPPADVAATTPREVSNSLGMKLELISAGEFMMGSGESGEELASAYPQYGLKPEWFSDEHPQHKVRITKPFYFSKYETTNADFQKFVDATGYKTQAELPDTSDKGPGGWGFNQESHKFEGRNPKYDWRHPGFPVPENQPVVDITWNDAVAFCNWLSEKEGKKYRLPTEAEWEYAARAGTTTRYWPSNDPEELVKYANTADADFFEKFPNYYPKNKTLAGHDGFALPAPVGSYPPNAFALCDIHGNVWEWTNDWYGEDYYSKSPVDDPQGPGPEPASPKKVRRGGAWHSAPLFTRIAFRNYNTLDSRYPNLGFRVVLDAN